MFSPVACRFLFLILTPVDFHAVACLVTKNRNRASKTPGRRGRLQKIAVGGSQRERRSLYQLWTEDGESHPSLSPRMKGLGIEKHTVVL